MPQPARETEGRPLLPWRALGTGAGVLGGEGLAGILHPALDEALAAADVIVPLVIAIVLLAAILCGSTQTCERVFRLLRWIANRPEPAAPETLLAGTRRRITNAGPDNEPPVT